MIEGRKADEIARIVVEGILILVMDVMTLGDRPVDVLPNLLMKALDALLTVLTARRVIDLIGAPLGVRIPPENDAPIGDRFDVSHTLIISS